MFTLFILFTTLATNRYGMCEGASKQTSIAPGHPPPRFEIPGSTTVNIVGITFHICVLHMHDS